jgi:hypothetical protein
MKQKFVFLALTTLFENVIAADSYEAEIGTVLYIPFSVFGLNLDHKTGKKQGVNLEL